MTAAHVCTAVLTTALLGLLSRDGTMQYNSGFILGHLCSSPLAQLLSRGCAFLSLASAPSPPPPFLLCILKPLWKSGLSALRVNVAWPAPTTRQCSGAVRPHHWSFMDWQESGESLATPFKHGVVWKARVGGPAAAPCASPSCHLYILRWLRVHAEGATYLVNLLIKPAMASNLH